MYTSLAGRSIDISLNSSEFSAGAPSSPIGTITPMYELAPGIAAAAAAPTAALTRYCPHDTIMP